MSDAKRASAPTLLSAIGGHARLSPERVAVQAGADRLSYSGFLRGALEIAAELARRGVGANSRVALLGANSAFHLLLLAACSRLGAAVAFLNWRLEDTELSECLERVQPSVLFASPSEGARARRLAPPEKVAASNAWAYPGAADARTRLPAEPSDAELPLMIVFTGASTGKAKAALISQRALFARAASACADFGISGDDTFLAWSPFFHVGATDQAVATLLLGGKVIVQDGFDAEAIAGCIASERLGRLVVVPGMIGRLIETLRARRPVPRGIKSLGAMADLIPAGQIAELTTLLSTPFTNSFGSTETGLSCASAATIPVGTAPARLPKKASSFCTLRLVDADGSDVPAGLPGELTVRGPTLFSGYLGDAEATARAFRGGWYHTADLCTQNPDGTIEFVDRLCYLIKCGGENVYPAEIERILLSDPRIAEAVVVRRRDAEWGEVPVVFVSLRGPGTGELAVAEILRERIARYKQPRSVFVVPEDRFPRGVNGKVLRREVESWLEIPRDPARA